MPVELINLFSNVAFPIAACVALGWFVWKQNRDTREDFKSREADLKEYHAASRLEFQERESKILESNKIMAEALDKSAVAIAEASLDHQTILDKICEVKEKIS